ncbi:phosphotyrosine protein phosphatase [Motiliproteus sp. MSK22-1]|nr:phosphotyrosine protein phosphatase [Motiliproteus sp. MSK22-1]
MFVCLGNICRSPTAHGVFEYKLKQQGLESQVTVDSAGTSDFHIGGPPDQRSTLAAKKRGYDLSQLRARQACYEDFNRFDYILAMDESNLHDLKDIAPDNSRATLRLFLDFSEGEALREVPDPYYGGAGGFDRVLDLIERASEGLLKEIRQKYGS